MGTTYNFEDLLKEIMQSPLKLKVVSFGGGVGEVEINEEERNRLLEQFHKGDISFQINIKKGESEIKILNNLTSNSK